MAGPDIQQVPGHGTPGTDPTIGAFDAAAADFSELTPHLWDPIGAGTVAATRPRAGERVLDACCGDGASALPAAQAVGPAGVVDAVDLSAPVAALAARRGQGLPQLRVHVADVTAWTEDGYDLVQCVLGVFFFPDMAAGTERLIRLARPGGRVGVTLWQRQALVPAGLALSDAVGRQRGERLPVPSASTRVQQLGDAYGLAHWLLGLGMADVDVVTVPHSLAATPEVLWLLVLGSGFRGMLAGLDDRAVEAVRAEYLDRLVGGPPIDATTLVAVGRRPGG